MKYYGAVIIWFWVGLVQAFYEPQGAIHYSYGHYRQVGRVQLLYPLSQSVHQLLYSQITGLLDSQSAHEGNFGLGYRVLKDTAIIGGYSFYDIRQTPYQNKVHQMTLGAEYLTLNDDIRGNIYLPFSKAKPIYGPLLNLHRIKSVIWAQEEVPLAGFDIEWNHRLPYFSSAQCATGYYYFYARKIKAIQGPRFKLHYPLTSWLDIEGEWSYDKARGHNYFIGARLSLALASKSISVHTLVDKMTQMPIRDIDVVVQAYSWDNEHTEPAIVISTPEELQSIGSGTDGMTLDANYLLAKDLDLTETKTLIHEGGSKGFKPIGTQESPFTGRFFGQQHTLSGLFIEDKEERKILNLFGHYSPDIQFLGLFGRVKGTKDKPVLIEHVHLAEASIAGSPSSKCGALAGVVEQAIIHHVSAQAYLSGASNNLMGGLIGEMKDTRLEQAYSKCSIQLLWSCAGGLVGVANHCYLSHVHSHASIGHIEEIGLMLGGLIGIMHEGTELKQAYSEGYIKFNKGYRAGGLVGWVTSQNDINHISDVYSTLNMQLRGKNEEGAAIGGLIGNAWVMKLERAYSSGSIEIEKAMQEEGLISWDVVEKDINVGGLIGSSGSRSSICDVFSTSPMVVDKAQVVGGLIGRMRRTALRRAYSQGAIKVKQGEVIGGLVGFADDLSYLCDVYSISPIETGGYNVYVGGLIGKGQGFELDRAYSAGPIQTADYARVGGLAGAIELSYDKDGRNKRHLRHVYSRCAIQVNEEAYAGGLCAVMASRIQLTQVHFFGSLNGPSDAIIDPMIVNQDGKMKSSSGPYDAISQVTDINHFLGWFNEGFWIMTPEGPELTWPKRADALLLLQYANSLKSLIATLPLELAAFIFSNVQFYGALNMPQLARLLYYAFIPFEQNIKGKARKLWHKEEFLNYVLTDSEPMLEGQKREVADTLSSATKRKRL